MAAGIVFWSAASGNTARFVAGLGAPSIRIPGDGGIGAAHGPHVLVTPTYADGEGRGAVPKPVIRFLNIEENRRKLIGVIGCGNRNFGAHFGLAARVISAKCSVPVLHLLEMSGTNADIEHVRQGLRSWTDKTWMP